MIKNVIYFSICALIVSIFDVWLISSFYGKDAAHILVNTDGFHIDQLLTMFVGALAYKFLCGKKEP